MIECQNELCAWIGTEDELEAPLSAMEPCCPYCRGSDFLDLDDIKEGER